MKCWSRLVLALGSSICQSLPSPAFRKSLQEPAISHGGNIDTVEISKGYKSGPLLFPLRVGRPAHHSGILFVSLCLCLPVSLNLCLFFFYFSHLFLLRQPHECGHMQRGPLTAWGHADATSCAPHLTHILQPPQHTGARRVRLSPGPWSPSGLE